MRVWGQQPTREDTDKEMKGKRHTTEEKIRTLREAEDGRGAQEICREHGISEQTFYR